jgi:hypothetical protein
VLATCLIRKGLRGCWQLQGISAGILGWKQGAASTEWRRLGQNEGPPGYQPGDLSFEKEVADRVDLRLPCTPSMNTDLEGESPSRR